MPWESPDWLTWDRAKDFADSEFFAALFAAMAGAYGGAWAAQRISERTRLRERHAEEIRSCNSAIELTGGILNTYLSLKGQHVRDLKLQYDEQLRRITEHYNTHARQGSPIPPLDLGQLNMAMLDIVRVRTARLEVLMQEKIGIGGRPLALLGFLLQSIDSLNDSIRSRNALLTQLRPLPLDQQIPLIFALPLAHGVDETYRDLIAGIYRETNDCIAFSLKICNDLRDFGERMRASYKRKYGDLVPRISEIKLRSATSEALLPDVREYNHLFTAYVSPPQRSHGRWLAKTRYAIQRSFRTLQRRSRVLFQRMRT